MRAFNSFRAHTVSVAVAILVIACVVRAQTTEPRREGQAPAVQDSGTKAPAQSPAPKAPDPKAPAASRPQTPAPSGQGNVIRRTFDMITTDVIVRDGKSDQFLPDLKKDEFEVYEDGVKQDVVSFILTHGGRVYNEAAPPAPPAMEGIILPASKPTSDAAGRIWLIFVDDLHLDFTNTARIKSLFKQISKELVHEGDMFGIVSSGPSSLSIDLTYDRKRLDEAIDKISGAGLKPSEILDAPLGTNGPSEVRYRAHVAFDTAYGIMKNLESVHNRRKAFVYVSNGYDFNPFSQTRAKNDAARNQEMNPNGGATDDGSGNTNSTDVTDENPFMQKGTEFSFADLASEISELTREANRANATIYTIDPRGLVGGPDIDQNVDMMDYQDYVRTSQNSLRVLAEQTGGFAVINQNDFVKSLKRIDAETSDYYVIGYYSTNPDPTKRRRRVEVKVNRPNVDLRYRTEYTLRPTKAPKGK